MVKPWPEAMVVVPLVCVNCPSPKKPVPDAVMAVVLAYGKVEAAEVEVALNTAAVGEEVEMTLPEESVASSWSLPREVAPVPPWDTGSVPIREPLARERQELLTA